MRSAIRIGARVQQPGHHRGVAVERGVIKRRDVVAVRGLRVGARGEQQIDELKVVALRSPVERGEAVRGGRIHVDALLQERADCSHVLFPRRIDQTLVHRLCGGRRHAGQTPTRRSATRQPERLIGNPFRRWAVYHKRFPHGL